MTVFTRPSNLAKKLPEEAAGTEGLQVAPGMFALEAEKVLHDEWRRTAASVDDALATEQYEGALVALAELRPAVDRYFDDVLVMAEDEAVRLNRLRQLAAVAATVRKVAHLDLIQGS